MKAKMSFNGIIIEQVQLIVKKNHTVFRMPSVRWCVVAVQLVVFRSSDDVVRGRYRHRSTLNTKEKCQSYAAKFVPDIVSQCGSMASNVAFSRIIFFYRKIFSNKWCQRWQMWVSNEVVAPANKIITCKTNVMISMHRVRVGVMWPERITQMRVGQTRGREKKCHCIKLYGTKGLNWYVCALLSLNSNLGCILSTFQCFCSFTCLPLPLSLYTHTQACTQEYITLS